MTISVVHLLSSFGVGGQERVALDLATRQKGAGCRVAAVALADGPLRRLFEDALIPTEVVEKRHGVDLTLPLRLARVLRGFETDVVHTHNPQPLIWGAPAARLIDAALVHTKHGANPSSERQLQLRRAAARLADAYVAVSAVTAEVARQKREVAESKLWTIPNGIDLDRFTRPPDERSVVRAALGIAPDAVVAITVARLAPEKNQTLMIAAMAPLLAPKAQLVLVGDGSERAKLEQQRQALGERARFVHLLGVRNDTPSLLAASDLFLLSSTTEGLPLVIPEAMAARLPVVSTNVGGISTVIVEGESGYLVPPGDEAALRQRIVKLLDDRALRERLGERGHDLAMQRYGLERVVREYLAVYRYVLRGRRRGRIAIS